MSVTIRCYVQDDDSVQALDELLEDVETMIPFERQIYVQMLSDWIEEENERIKQREAQLNAR